MKLAVITQPFFFDSEALMINQMFDAGLEKLHLRKPGASSVRLERFLAEISENRLDRIVVHSHFELVGKWGLRGAHFGKDRSMDIIGFTGTKSFSCHSFEEVIEYKPHCDYVFLSPVFNSISKPGYSSAFTDAELVCAVRCGVTDSKVFALGGVTEGALPYLAQRGFGGAAVLGDVWENADPPERVRKLLDTVSGI